MWIRWTANAVSSRGLVKEERFLKASGRSEARVNEETKEREPSRATRGTIGPPYASALEGWVAGTTTSRCTTSPSRATWSSRKDKACSECGASSTGATRPASARNRGLWPPTRFPRRRRPRLARRLRGRRLLRGGPAPCRSRPRRSVAPWAPRPWSLPPAEPGPASPLGPRWRPPCPAGGPSLASAAVVRASP